jgi:transglutaminase-like putative cysteine protease
MKTNIGYLTIIITIILLISIQNCNSIDNQLAGDEFPFYYDYLDMNINVSGEINLSGNLDSISNLKAKLSHYPKDEENTELIFFNPYPEYEIKNETLHFYFKNDVIKRNMPYYVHSRNNININKKIIIKDALFPLTSLPLDYKSYIQPTSKIDINKDITTKSSSLVWDTEGVFEATFKIAEWVHENIEYKSDNETENVVQLASWVFNNKKGVCDEITTLFIAMTRSVGIPSRFVSGLAYTDKTKEFDNHAWAEVYMGEEYGWVPFDVTYGEFGWIDSSHVVLARSHNSKINTLECSALGTSVEIFPSNVKFNAVVNSKGHYDFPNLEIELEPLSRNIGAGYNIIEAKIINNEKGYVAEEVTISNVNNLEIIGKKRDFVFIEPNGFEKIRWVVKVNESIDKQASYKFPVEVSLRSNISEIIYFNVSSKGILYSESYINNIIQEEEKIEIKEYSKKINVDCELSPIYIIGRETELNCAISNNGERDLKSVSVCIQELCKTLSLNQFERKEIKLEIKFEEQGLQTVELTLDNKDLTKKEYLNFNVKDQPNMNIDLSYPKTARFEDRFITQINISVISISRPKKLNITFVGSGIKKEWHFNSMDIDQVINLRLKGQHLYAGENNLKIILEWENELGERFKQEKEIKIELIDLNLWQKFYSFINKITSSST